MPFVNRLIFFSSQNREHRAVTLVQVWPYHVEGESREGCWGVTPPPKRQHRVPRVSTLTRQKSWSWCEAERLDSSFPLSELSDTVTQRIIILTDYSMSCGQAQVFTLGYRNLLTAYIYCITCSWRDVTITVLITAKRCFFLEQGCFCCCQGDVEHRNVSWACWCSLLLQQKAAFSVSGLCRASLFFTWDNCTPLWRNILGACASHYATTNLVLIASNSYHGNPFNWKAPWSSADAPKKGWYQEMIIMIFTC